MLKGKSTKILLIMVCAIAVIGGFMSTGLFRKGIGVSNMINTNPVIVIDAGHGGFDGGACSEDGVCEKDINLNIAKTLQQYCHLYGLEVVMTRDSDSDIGDNPEGKLKERKKADMEKRLEIMYDNPNSIFVSIHQNKFPQEKYWGTQVFYTTNAPSSSKLAQKIQDRIQKQLQPDNKREIKPGNNDMYLLKYAKSPSVIVECGFLSNLPELQRLKDPSYQQQLAYCIFLSLIESM